MKKIAVILFLLNIYGFTAYSQQKYLISGPMLGYVEHREVAIWVESASGVQTLEITYFPELKPDKKKAQKITIDKINPKPVKFVLGELEIGTKYIYVIKADKKLVTFNYPLTFKTRFLWEFRQPNPPDFSFMIGSCAYFNDSLYDRPGKGYGSDPSIFKSMAKSKADFMIWGGDNFYYREPDFSSVSGLAYRQKHDRSVPEMQELLTTQANYAIWDDHDYGPNDADRGFEFKQESRELFKMYWANKTVGKNEQGIYSKVSFSDVDIFLLDDRYFRAPNRMPDSVNGKPNAEKVMWGKEQMEWLKDQLITSRATFKIIVNGNQFLDKLNKYEGLTFFPSEYQEFTSFIKNSGISGVVLLSGDRHYTQLQKHTQITTYPIYEFTCSPLTSGVTNLKPDHPEFNNPDRVKGTLTMEQNFGLIKVSGSKSDRNLTIETKDKNGELKWSHVINEKELKKSK